MEKDLEKATFAAGCYWCVEAVFQRAKGVKKIVSGFMGGHVKNPAYREVCNGTTGHAEVAQIYFNPEVITYEELLEIFWKTHDPTTLNRQGNDIGTQYRSEIFYHNEVQKRKAELSKEAAEKSGDWENKIVTKITEASEFYQADDYHQDYFNNNIDQPYCQLVVKPKVEKFKKLFGEFLKDA